MTLLKLDHRVKIIILVVAAILVAISLGVCLWQTSLWISERQKRKKALLTETSRSEAFPIYSRVPTEVQMKNPVSLAHSLSLNSGDFDPVSSHQPVKEDEIARITLGKVEFSCSYYHPRSCLRIILHRITCYPVLPSVYGNVFLYVIISLGPDSGLYFESDMQPINEDNLIDEMCEFDIDLNEALKKKILLSVYVCDKFSLQRELGQIEYSLEKETRSPDSRLLAIEKLTHREMQRSEKKKDAKTVVAPEILFSLCYMPTSGRLTVVILKGRNIKHNEQDVAGVFMKISLLVGGRTVKSTQTSLAKKPTDPVYNEAFVFGAPLDKIRESNLIITVLCKKNNETSTVLGRLIVGLDSDSKLGRKHWETMLFTARKPIAQWHYLSQFL